MKQYNGHGSWVVKDDPFPSILQLYRVQPGNKTIYASISHLVHKRISCSAVTVVLKTQYFVCFVAFPHSFCVYRQWRSYRQFFSAGESKCRESLLSCGSGTKAPMRAWGWSLSV